MKDSRHSHVRNEYPLVDQKISRQDCLDWMKEKGYPQPPRSACRFCPFRSDKEWRELRDNEPEEFQKVVLWERSMQKLQDIDGRLDGNIYVHHSGVSIDKVELGESAESGFDGDCTGMCGN